MSKLPPPVLPLLPNPRTKPKSFKSGEAAIVFERVQFDSWREVFTAKNSKGQLRRKNGSVDDFKRFFQQMMPLDTAYTLERVSSGTYELIIYRLVPQGQENLRLFSCKGSMRVAFTKLVEHYGAFRKEYFEDRYSTKYLNISITDTLKKGLNPPKPEVKYKIKEKIVKQDVPVPGEKVDVISHAMEQVYEFFINHVSGHKGLPNVYRKVKDADISTKLTGNMVVTLELGP